MNKLKRKVVSSKYRTTAIVFSFLTLAFLIATVVISVLIFSNGSGYIHLNTLFVVFLVLFLLSSIVFVLFLYFSLANRIRREVISRYFSNRNIVYSDFMVEQSLVTQFKKRTVKPSVIIAFSIYNFEDLVVNIFGRDYANSVLDTIALYLRTKYSYQPKYHYGFDYVDSFIIIKETEDIDSFREEFKSLCKELVEEINKLSIVLNCDFIAGATLFDIYSKISPREIFERAQVARKWSEDRIFNDFVFYDNYMSSSLTDELGIISDIESALKNDEFEPYYQPKYDLKLKRFTGAEALARWNHPQRGIISPVAFIKMAEKTGKVIDIDKYMFERVCEDISSWKTNRVRLLTISCNLSRRTIHDKNILPFIKETIEKYKVNPLLIEFEITETVASQDLALVYSIVKKLKDLGVSVSIDDMGTGYSSLATLKRLPFDAIKIDKSFFDDVEVNKRARDVASTIANLGKALDMSVVAEGIQNAKQVEIVRNMNVDLIQGYYYSRPLSKYSYELFLANNRFEERKEK